MPTIQGVATWNSSIQVPTTNDVITAEAFTLSAQQLANQAAWNYDAISTTGVRALRIAADLAALSAIADQTDGQCALVPQVGLYTYVAGATTSADSWRVVTPAGGGGRWYHAVRSLLGVASGLVQLGSSAKVPLSHLAYQTFLTGALAISGASTSVPAGGSVTPLTGGAITLTGAVAIGDLVEIDGLAYAIPEAAPAAANVYARTGAGNAYSPKSPVVWPTGLSGLGVAVPVIGRYTVTNTDATNGAVTVALAADATTSAVAVVAVALRCAVVRP